MHVDDKIGVVDLCVGARPRVCQATCYNRIALQRHVIREDIN